ncbi:unnamed protein product [Amoebophrya sp. A25]|nr:unnamed protein product [Amoebophrya sp. A25]|eukprot:GSA25T00016595001.1
MALMSNNALEPYSGAPRQQRSRGFVTVREPALGFFLTGSTVDDMNGIYVCVKNDSVTELMDPKHEVLLAYKNDNRIGYVMVLVQPKQKPKTMEEKMLKRARKMQKRKQKQARQMRHLYGGRSLYGDDSDEDSDEEEEEESSEEDSDDDEVHNLRKREWLVIDQRGKDRFRHDGDTIIPGAGTSWKHLHRLHPDNQKKVDDEELSCQEDEDDYASVDSDAENKVNSGNVSRNNSKKSKEASSSSSSRFQSTAIQPKEEKPDDEDELPWQVIAILDKETVQDMRYTARCYDANIREAKSGRRLPKVEALTGLDPARLAGCWVYKVTASAGVEVRVSPFWDSPVIAHTRKGEFLQVVEKRTIEDEDHVWLKLKTENRFDAYSGMYGYGGGIFGNRDDWIEERWVSLRDEDADPTDASACRLQEVVDLPEMTDEMPKEQADAAAFDRPFEPRLEDAAREEEAEEEDISAAAAAKLESAGAGEANVDLSRYRIAEDEESEEAVPDVGSEVALEGLKNESYNGEIAVVVKSLVDGRIGVQLKKDDTPVAVKLSNVRLHSGSATAPNDGPLAQHARKLGLSLSFLGLTESASDIPASGEKTAEKAEENKENVEVAKKSTEDESPLKEKVASSGTCSTAASEAASPDTTEEKMNVSEQTEVQSGSRQEVEKAQNHVCEVLATALCAANRDAGPANFTSLQTMRTSYEALVNAVYPAGESKTHVDTAAVVKEMKFLEAKAAKKQQQATTSSSEDSTKKSPTTATEEGSSATTTTSSSSSHSSPMDVLKRGQLGKRAQKASMDAEDTESIKSVVYGVQELRRLVVDEVDDETADSLRLRLTLVNGLLKCRREADASKEAAVALKMFPDSCCAALWQARFLIRRGKIDEGVELLQRLASGESAANALLGKTSSPSDDSTTSASTSSTKSARMAQVNPDASWARLEAARRLKAWKDKERGERRAMDAYSRGLFKDAAGFYDSALAGAVAFEDDKWCRAELFAARAACFRREREWTKALDDLDSALSLYPKYKRALFRKGVVQLDASRPTEAIKSFETLLGLDRDWENLLDWLVRAHAMQRRAVSGKARANDYMGGMFSDAKMGTWAEAAQPDDIADMKDHYAVLGVTQDATEKMLKRAYRIMSLKYHPDKEGGSTRAFQRVATAYQTLSDPEKREQYDNGADLKHEKKNNDDSDSDGEQEKKSLREEIERKYFPERYKFWPFGDPFVQKRKLMEQRQRRAGRPNWWDNF